ncbi:MAG: carcinine hydrolase/isopenicillin-N N-acyltransferase family protein [Bacteroidales bacterium]|nr:carcinine hydrolase/isopenicillin-N N-acyltransferase family protein [Bacteroidales bacterium]
MNRHPVISSLSAALLAASFSLISCEKEAATKKAVHITDPAKVAMINSMKDLDGKGRLYELNYTADYKLDKVLASQKTAVNELFQYVAYLLYDNLQTKAPEVDYGTGCSCFAVPESEGQDFLMGRNYDYRHFGDDKSTLLPTAAILVHTAPEGGKKSISMVDGMHLGFGRGFYDEADRDLSLMMALPYAALDGINEDGFAIGVLALNEAPAKQNRGKPRIGTTVAIRMLLDRASTVREAVKMLDAYDMDMGDTGRSSYHFFMADATGDYAIVEYSYVGEQENPGQMEVLKGVDTLRCVTNFYVSPSMAGTNDGWGSLHGRDRYDTMRSTLQSNNYSLSGGEAMSLLSTVSQDPTDELTSMTQWSAVYNLSEKSLRLSILREYGKAYDFRVE